MVFRKPGIHETSEERVLLVTKHKRTGAERCDWWPSIKEAEESDQIVLEVRRTLKVEKHKSDWTGLASMLYLVLGKSGNQDKYVRTRALDQMEFFESVADKTKTRKEINAEFANRPAEKAGPSKNHDH